MYNVGAEKENINVQPFFEKVNKRSLFFVSNTFGIKRKQRERKDGVNKTIIITCK